MPPIPGSLDLTGFPRRAALLVAALGLTVLIGWALDIHWLKSMLPGAIEMKANTALSFLLAGGALFLRLQAPGLARPVPGMALVVAAIGFATLAEYLSGRQFGIDQLLFREPGGALYTLYPGRMSIYAATGFSAIGFALLVPGRPGLRLPAQLAAAWAILVGAVPLLGYLWGIGTLTTASMTTPAAPHTGLGLVLLGAALLKSLPRGRIAPFRAVEFKVLLGFSGALLLILFSSGVTYRITTLSSESAKLVAHTQEVRAMLGTLYSTIADAESAQRAYLLTGEKDQQIRYAVLVENLPAHLGTLSKLVGDNPAQLQHLAALRPLIAQRLAELARVKSAYEHNGLVAAQQELIVGRGLETMHEIDILIKTMESIEIELLKTREATAEETRKLTLVSMLATLLLAVILLTGLFAAIRREMQARDKAEAYDSTHRLALLLYSTTFSREHPARPARFAGGAPRLSGIGFLCLRRMARGAGARGGARSTAGGAGQLSVE